LAGASIFSARMFAIRFNTTLPKFTLKNILGASQKSTMLAAHETYQLLTHLASSSSTNLSAASFSSNK